MLTIMPLTSTDQDLAGRTALVTGASSGIGRAVATRLAQEGAAVALVARRAEPLRQHADDLRRRGARAVSIAADVGRPEAVAGAVRQAREAHGPIDLLVNVAGSYTYAPADSATVADWTAMIDSSLYGTLLTTRAVLDDLLDQAAGGGPSDVFCISSVAATRPFAGFSVYGAAKAAVQQFAAGLRADVGPRGVRVSTIELGLVATEPALAFASQEPVAPPALQSEDVADLIAYAASRPAGVSFGHVLALPTAQV